MRPLERIPTYFDGDRPAFSRLAAILSIAFLISLIGCSEIRTDEAAAAYRSWAGQSPPESVRVINGRYWQSSHFTKEYILYLELKAPKDWIREFIILNKLTEYHGRTSLQSDAPGWFRPPSRFKRYRKTPHEPGPNASTCYIDFTESHMYLYEEQL